MVSLEKDIAQAKSTTTTATLIESIATTTPLTDADVAALGRLMDKYPMQGQKALAKITDPKLAKAIQTECARKIDQYKADKDKDWSKLPPAERIAKVGAFMSSQAMIVKLGNLKNKDSLPFLKQYITPEYDGTLSYTASAAIGRIAPDDPVIFQELWNKKDMKSINYGAYGKSMLKEVAQKLQDPGISGAEKDSIRAKANVLLLEGRTPEEKELLKDIVLHHPDRELRKDAADAIVKALMFHSSDGDVEFVMEWTKNPKDVTGGFSMTYMRDHFDKRFIPVVLRYMKEGDAYDRGEALKLIGQNEIKEALPDIKVCITQDKDSSVRGNCRVIYWEMTGEMSSDFTPQDAIKMDRYLNNPRVLRTISLMSDNDLDKKQYFAQKMALDAYNAANSR